MKKTRLLGYLLAAAACALSIPACGGGGEDDSGDRYISVRQFALGGKAFKIEGTPALTLRGIPSERTPWSQDAAEDAVQGPEYGPAGSGNVPPPAVSGEYEGSANMQGVIVTPHGSISVDMNYATFGGSTGTGVIEIRPQDAPTSVSDPVAHDVVTFLGAVTPNDAQLGSDADMAFDSDYSRIILFTISGLSYRALIDFSKGSLDFYVEYPASWRAVAVDSSGNVIPNAFVPMNEVIAALRFSRSYFVVSD